MVTPVSRLGCGCEIEIDYAQHRLMSGIREISMQADADGLDVKLDCGKVRGPMGREEGGYPNICLPLRTPKLLLCPSQKY